MKDRFKKIFGREPSAEDLTALYVEKAVKEQHTRYLELVKSISKFPSDFGFEVYEGYCVINRQTCSYSNPSTINLAVDFVNQYEKEIAKKREELLAREQEAALYRPKFEALKDRVEHLGGNSKLNVGEHGAIVTLPRRHKAGRHAWSLDLNEYNYYLLYDEVLRIEELHAQRKARVQAQEGGSPMPSISSEGAGLSKNQ